MDFGLSLYQEAFRLKDNPFSTTAPSIERPIVWAGRESLKKKLVETIETMLITSPSRVIINWGEWGAGKTHAMKYFSREQNLGAIAKKLKVKTGFSIPAICPRSNVLESLYLSIIESIGLKKLKEIAEEVMFKKEVLVREKQVLRHLEETGFDYSLAKTLQALCSRDRRMRTTAERYLYLESTGSDLKTLGVPKRIRTELNMLRTLAQLFGLFLSESSPYSRVFLWIDEMETIENLTGKELTNLRFFLRSMVDFVPQGLTIFLNATRKAGDLEGFFSYLGAAVLERVYKVIEFPVMNEKDVINYVYELINSPIYRDPNDIEILKKKHPRAFQLFPFRIESIPSLFRLLTEHLKRKPTPRNINDALSSILDLAVREERLIGKLKALQETIDSDFIRENWDTIKLGIHVSAVM